MLPWMTAIVLLVFPVAVADFDYRYLLPVLPFAGLAAGLAFAPAAAATGGEPDTAAQAPQAVRRKGALQATGPGDRYRGDERRADL
jgi:hypothetical protein